MKLAQAFRFFRLNGNGVVKSAYKAWHYRRGRSVVIGAWRWR